MTITNRGEDKTRVNSAPSEYQWPGQRELGNRALHLRQLMDEDRLDGILLLQNADLLYFCGTTQAEAVYLPRLADPVVLAHPPLDRVKAETALSRVEPMPAWSDLMPLLERFAGGKPARVGLELDVLPVNYYRRLRDTALAGAATTDASPHIRRARSFKSEYELNLMRIAAKNLDAVFRAVPATISRGMSEMELEGRLFALARKNGYQGMIRGRGFNMEMSIGHVLSGVSGLVPSKVPSPTGGVGVNPGFGQGAGPRKIGPGELVSVDLVGAFGGYVVDQTRLFFTGPVPDRVRRTYDALLKLVDELLSYIRPGVLSGEVYEKSFALAEKYGIAENFMNLGGVVCPFVGHGLGIELDEWPALARGTRIPLDKGMTFAFEPRVFLTGIGVLGIEDTFVLTEEGPEQITVTGGEIKVLDFGE